MGRERRRGQIRGGLGVGGLTDAGHPNKYSLWGKALGGGRVGPGGEEIVFDRAGRELLVKGENTDFPRWGGMAEIISWGAALKVS